jgi:hypothetical protein
VADVVPVMVPPQTSVTVGATQLGAAGQQSEKSVNHARTHEEEPAREHTEYEPQMALMSRWPVLPHLLPPLPGFWPQMNM